jgi:hypothetical protein
MHKKIWLKIKQLLVSYKFLLLGLPFFCMSAIASYRLLNSSTIANGDLITLIIAFALIGTVLSFSSEIQEFSVGGNIVKFKEVKADAENAILELKLARTETFRFLLNISMGHTGSFFSEEGKPDARLRNFWFLYNQITNFKCESELAHEITKYLNLLLVSQIHNISHDSNNVSRLLTTPLPTPTEEAAQRRSPRPSIDDLKRNILSNLDEYRKLYELHLKLENMS